jgi:hypothetical protein
MPFEKSLERGHFKETSCAEFTQDAKTCCWAANQVIPLQMGTPGPKGHIYLHDPFIIF